MRAKTKARFAADLFHVVAVVAMFFITSIFAFSGSNGLNLTIGKRTFIALVAGYCCAFFYDQFYYPREARRQERNQWAAKEQDRSAALLTAGSTLARAIQDRTFNDADFVRVVGGLLAAILYEVETVVLDGESRYLNVNLLTVDPANCDKMKVVARARPTRPIPAFHQKAGMAAWEAMERCTHAYREDFRDPNGEKKYRCILAFPVLTEDDRGERKALAAVSIDSGEPHNFDGLLEEIKRKIDPGLAFLKVAIVLANREASAPPRTPPKRKGRMQLKRG